jgi:hypothetical protein
LILLPGSGFGVSVSFGLVYGLEYDDVVLGLQGKVFRQETGKLKLNHELVVGSRNLEAKLNALTLRYTFSGFSLEWDVADDL